MGLLIDAAFVAGFFAGWAAWLRNSGPWSEPDELQFTRTEDGWTLALSRWRPRAAARRSPVLLLHGLAASRETFDPDPRFSLARHLCGRGYDVWALELRGHGRSERPSLFGAHRYGWGFEHYLRRDLPAALAHLRAAAGGREPHWIGHSMGGILALAHLACGGAARSVTTIASSLDYSGSGSGFHKVTGLKPLFARLPLVPAGPLAFLSAPLALRFPSPIDRFFVEAENVDAEVYRRWLTRGVHTISAPVLAQLVSAFDPGGLRTSAGDQYQRALSRVKVPVLLLAGDRDRQCPPAAAAASYGALGAADKKLALFGPEHGHAGHYGHIDLVLGLRAAAEVYPHIDAWLDAHD